MKAFIFWLLLIFFGLNLSGSHATAQTPTTPDPLTNAAIVKFVKADFKEKTIISIIGSSPTRFDLSPDRMIELKKSGVSEKVILAMLARQQGVDFDENWSDENFSNLGNDNQKTDKQNGAGQNPSASDNSTDIFGSSGGFHGSTKSKGGNSVSGGDTVTTGTATVRILRPPTEAGALPKLEKVATLTNDSIVELIEAGFSEGTIIRRIERSPVEFDLSPEKLTELRKHRVTDKILSAMKAAAGDTSDSKTAPHSNGLSRQ
ncbi:MAG: hypothetical protein ACREA9_08040 [Pyrinomonadaceae bacterium]